MRCSIFSNINEPFMSYKPSSFVISYKGVDFTANDIFKLESNKELIGYFHEYIHFIQDISSLTGFLLFLCKYNNAVSLTKITCKTTGKIQLPIQEDVLKEIEQDEKMAATIEGDHIDFGGKIVDSHYPEVKEIAFKNNYIYELTWVIVLENSTENVKIGIHAMQEAQAYYAQKAIENKILSEYWEQLPLFPYKWLDILIRKFNITASNEELFLLLDLVLDTLYPQLILKNVLESFKNRNLTELGGQIIIDEVDAIIEGIYDHGATQNYQIQEAINTLSKDANGRSNLIEAFKWYFTAYINTSNWKKENRLWFYNWLKNPDNNSFSSMQKLFPNPLAIDQVGAIFSAIKEEDMMIIRVLSFWYVFDCIYNFGKPTTSLKCPFFEACKYDFKKENEVACITGTWGLATCSPTCFIGEAWQQYGFANSGVEIELS